MLASCCARTTRTSGAGRLCGTASGGLQPVHHSPGGSRLRTVVASTLRAMDTRSVRVPNDHVQKSM
jgi:hypothetical protein